MRIGLISINMYSKQLNFACPIHTYAFQQFLKGKGIDSTVVNYQPVYYNGFDLEHPADYYAQKYDRLLARNEDACLEERLEKCGTFRDLYKSAYREREIRYRKFQNFIDKHYVKTDICYNSDLLEVEDPGFDCYICVTDVIWRYAPHNGFDRGFFLASKAMENKWKISYAASRGVPPVYTPEQEAEFLHYVDDIDFVSVREESLQRYLQESTDKEVSLVLDPVLLLDGSFYDEIAVAPKDTGYIVLYYVMERANDTIRMAVDYARSRGLKIIELCDNPDSHRLDEFDDVEKVFRYDIGVEEWLGYIEHAECVFTNSFHGTCFSILFHKRFYVGKRNGDKVTNLLKLTGLSNRRVSSYNAIDKMGNPEIDYIPVDEALSIARRQSEQFILNAIQQCGGGAPNEIMSGGSDLGRTKWSIVAATETSTRTAIQKLTAICGATKMA